MVLAHGNSEVDQFNVRTEKPEGWTLPRVKDAKIAFLCEKYAIHEIGSDPQALILGKINRLWIDDEVISSHEKRITIDPSRIDPLSRLGGNHYAKLGEILTVKRPDKPQEV